MPTPRALAKVKRSPPDWRVKLDADDAALDRQLRAHAAQRGHASFSNYILVAVLEKAQREGCPLADSVRVQMPVPLKAVRHVARVATEASALADPDKE